MELIDGSCLDEIPMADLSDDAQIIFVRPIILVTKQAVMRYTHTCRFKVQDMLSAKAEHRIHPQVIRIRTCRSYLFRSNTWIRQVHQKRRSGPADQTRGSIDYLWISCGSGNRDPTGHLNPQVSQVTIPSSDSNSESKVIILSSPAKLCCSLLELSISCHPGPFFRIISTNS
jgi:hypothetical protein